MPNQKKKNAGQKNSNKNTINENTKKQEEIKKSEEKSNKKIEQEKGELEQAQKQETEQKQETNPKQHTKQGQTTKKTASSKTNKSKKVGSKADFKVDFKADTVAEKNPKVKENKKKKTNNETLLTQNDTKKEKNEEQEKVTHENEKDQLSKNEQKQLTKNEIKAMQETVAKEMKTNKQIPETELNKINTRVFQNICLAIIMMFYFNFVILGFINIENAVFLIDLKVFSLVILAIAIGVFEYAYKKDSGRHAIHGIEVLVMALITISLIYVNIMMADKFIVITVMITYIFAIYYIAKSIVIYKRMKKQYFINNMKEMIKKK